MHSTSLVASEAETGKLRKMLGQEKRRRQDLEKVRLEEEKSDEL